MAIAVGNLSVPHHRHGIGKKSNSSLARRDRHLHCEDIRTKLDSFTTLLGESMDIQPPFWKEFLSGFFPLQNVSRI